MNPFDLDIASDMNSEHIGLFIDGQCVAIAKDMHPLMRFKQKHYKEDSFYLSNLHQDHPEDVIEIAELPQKIQYEE